MLAKHYRDNPMYTEKSLLLGAKQLVQDPARFRTNFFDSKTFAKNSVYNKSIERGFRPVSNKSIRNQPSADPERAMMSSFYAPSELISPMYQTQKDGFMFETKFPRQHEQSEDHPGGKIMKSMQRLRDLSLRDTPQPRTFCQTFLASSKHSVRPRVRRHRPKTKGSFVVNLAGFRGTSLPRKPRKAHRQKAGFSESNRPKQKRMFAARNRGDWTFKQEQA